MKDDEETPGFKLLAFVFVLVLLIPGMLWNSWVAWTVATWYLPVEYHFGLKFWVGIGFLHGVYTTPRENKKDELMGDIVSRYIRNAWLMPLALLGFAWLVKTVIF